MGPDEPYSYAVTPLDALIRREFIVPDLSNVFAMRRRSHVRRAGQGAQARRARHHSSGDSNADDDTDSDSSDSDSDSESEELGAVANERMLKDEPSKRWPRWIRP